MTHHTSMIVNWIPHIVKIVSKSKYLTSPTIIEIIKHLRTIKYCTSYFASSQAVHGSTTGGVAMGLSSLWISFVVYCYHRTVILVNKFFSFFCLTPCFILFYLVSCYTIICFTTRMFFFLFLFNFCFYLTDMVSECPIVHEPEVIPLHHHRLQYEVSKCIFARIQSI